MRGLAILISACLLAQHATALAGPPTSTKIAGELHKQCQALDEVKVCFTSDGDIVGWRVLIGGRRTPVLFNGDADGTPFEMERRQGHYRVKIGSPSRSDMPFFAYDEAIFARSGDTYHLLQFVMTSDKTCGEGPDIRMIYQFDLPKSTMTSILNPSWSNDGKAHRFVHSVKLPSKDLFRLSWLDFVYRLADRRAGAAVERLCTP